jgi:lipopolysaccharide export system protein LptC
MSSHTDTNGRFHGTASSAVRQAQRAGLAFKLIIMAVAAALLFWSVWMLLPRLWQGPVDITIRAPEMPGQAVSYESDVKGLDKEQKPYRIQASRGYQDAHDKNIVHLETFNGTFKRGSGTDLTVTSKNGVYDAKGKTLGLSGDVVIHEDGKFSAKMDKAQFDVEKRQLVSQSPVQVETENGHIAADSLTADNNGERMVFRGNVKARFNSSDPQNGGNQ